MEDSEKGKKKGVLKGSIAFLLSRVSVCESNASFEKRKKKKSDI